MHPGAAAAISKFSMNEYDIAVEIMTGGLTSPQEFMGLWLFDMRITGTGMSFRAQHKEFVMRDPSLYLNEEFLSRCNGLEVIIEHPPEATLDTEEYRDRIVGSIMLPYIKGDEVWGIARIRDAACAAMLTDPERNSEYSTSPTVVFRKGDGNTSHVIDGQKILVEGKPSLLDHLAICRVGVWDKGGEPNGIVSTRGDSQVAEKEMEKKDDATKKADGEDNMSMMDAFKKFGDQLRADIAKDCDTKMDALRADMAKADKKKADSEEEEDKEKKEDSLKKADGDDDKIAADAKKKADAEEDEKEKKADKKKADSEDEMEKKDDAARADAAIENHPLMKAMREQIATLSSRIPAEITDLDRSKFADAQSFAERAYSAHGKSAPAPLMGETYLSYRKRLAAGQKANSKRAKDVDVMAIADEATLGVIETMIYDDAIIASKDSTNIPAGQLRRRVTKTSTGHNVVEYDGDPGSWMSAFMAPAKATSTHAIRDPQRR
jgi:hypothetical protein